MNIPLISIIMPTYNRESLLSRAINSVISQTYPNWELIIVDDCSSDNTKSLIDNYSKGDNRIRYLLNERKKGPAGARNHGIFNAKGKYIAFLDSDDEWFNHHLNDGINVLENEKVDVCFALWLESKSGALVKFDDSIIIKESFKRVIEDLNPKIKGNLVFFDEGFFEYVILTGFYCYHINTMILNKDVLKTTGVFNEDLLTTEDTEFAFRVLHHYNICLINDYHFIYNEGEDNIYRFMDRDSIKIDELIYKRRLIDKLNFDGTFKNKMRVIVKKFIEKSDKIIEKGQCIYILDKTIAKKYFSLGVINIKINKFKSVYFFLKAMIYEHKKAKYEHKKSDIIVDVLKLLLPKFFGEKNMESLELDYR